MLGKVVTYELIGKLAVICAVLIILVNIAAFLIGLYCVRKKKIIFPRFVLLTLYLFYSPLKWLFSVFGVNDKLIDEILIDFQNAVYADAFRKRPGDRKIILLPHCLRDGQCKARCDPLFGYVCKRCGRCGIDKIIEAADIYGYKVFIIPGGSFIRKIMKEYHPTACIGVACPIELSEAMVIGAKIPTQGVYLEKDGCFETIVDVDEIIEKMKMGISEEISEDLIRKYDCAGKKKELITFGEDRKPDAENEEMKRDHNVS
ncbi:DUF116 domain-containing protein [Methanosarcinaceae archaeon]|nr:DUF116 domain-containing protein [Methanosarcinaceae archaeon]MBQ3620316.1 DUF116 domain-containing protein [Methanosarcinaceae archaeon]